MNLANITKCRSGRLPIIYLGLPIGAKPRSKTLWDLMIEKFMKKLSNGRGIICLSVGESPLSKLAYSIFQSITCLFLRCQRW